MTALKCKMCGGTITPLDSRTGKCEYCETLVLLPLIDEERILNLYNRGNHFREVGEYDRAYSAYESIIAENRDDPEAHWCLMLCRYGINYVQDKEKNEFRPTISRMNRTPILEDPDYQAALRCSDGELKEQYRAEAQKLTNIQNRFLDIMKREQPYDVFICFKAEEEGKHTKASEIGHDIYEELTAQGLRVFFSRITLENKIGEEYEPYIFSALYTAKVMLVVADKAPQLTARWVKNEWIRFLAMMDHDPGKAIIPVFYQMSPYDFPPELSIAQGQDMEKLGAIQDLSKNVLNLCGKAPESVRLVKSGTKLTAGVDSSLRRVRMIIDDDDFAEALDRLNAILKEDPENGEAWYYLLLAKNQAKGWMGLMSKGYHWNKEPEYRKAIRYASVSIHNELEELDLACTKESKYQEALELLENKKDYEAAIPLLREVGDHKNAPKLLMEAQNQVERIRAMKEYDEEVGDGYDYITNRIKEEHPKEYAQYQKYKSRYKRTPDTSDFSWWYVIIVAALWGGSIYMGLSNDDYPLIMYVGIVFAGAAVLGLAIGVGMIFESFIAGVIALVILGALFSKIPENIQIIIGIILAFGSSIICILGVIFIFLEYITLESKKKYYKQVIEPMENKIRQEVNQKWGPLIEKKKLVPLKGIDEIGG